MAYNCAEMHCRTDIAAVDLFCGAGGLSRGFINAGLPVVAGVDADPACEYPYKANIKGAEFFLQGIKQIQGENLDRWYGQASIRVLAGCAPCQTFSLYSLNKTKSTDERWGLLNEFARLVKESQPQVVTMENVAGLTRHKLFSGFLTVLEKLNYEVEYQLVDCADYGIPQRRVRLVLLASQLGGISLRKPGEGDQRRTVRDTIGSLPELRAGSSCESDPLHAACRLSELNMQRIKASKAGGTWRDWDENLIAECHRKGSGKTFPSVYGRMSWDDPAPTITTQFFGFGNGRFGHPSQSRALSLREGALLQTFPLDYKFAPDNIDVPTHVLGRLIGNAVPVKLGQVIAESVLIHIENIRES